MMKKYWSLFLALVASSFIVGCESEPIIPQNPEIEKPASYADPRGAFVLNEGNFSTEDGYLHYLSPTGEIEFNIYQRINTRSLGKTAQDMAFYGDYAYIICQGGTEDNDGYLTVVDAKTFKRVANYSTELSELQNPTHLVVADDNHIIIRDNMGLWMFDRDAKTLKKIEGSELANKKPMILMDGKAFVGAHSKLLVVDPISGTVEKTIEFENEVSGLAIAGEGKLYVSLMPADHDIICLLDTKTLQEVKRTEIPQPQPAVSGYAWRSIHSTSYIVADGDNIYSMLGGTSLYRHTFSTGKTEMIFDILSVNPEHKVIYNSPAIHPLTKHIYISSLLDYGWKFLVNTIYEIEDDGTKGEMLRRIDGITHFTAGIYFPMQK